MNKTSNQLLIGAGLLMVGLLGSVFSQSMMGQPGNGGTGQGYGQGMMGGNGMGGGMMGGNGMGGMMSIYAPSARPISQDEARRRAQGFVGRYGSQVKIRDFMVFAENYYVQVVDAATGAGLAEVLVDRYTGVVRPEPGPDMLWNIRFGMQGGEYGNSMMRAVNQGRPVASTPVRYTKVAAQKLADTFLAEYLPGGKVLEGLPFPGYYTFDYGRTAIEGMLSVNAFTGEVWVHGWHGVYLGEVK
jgi:hypothetical protein